MGDEFDKIISVMKTKSIEDLYYHFGKPDEVALTPDDSNVQIFRYRNLLVDAYVNKSANKISHLTLFYWKDFDNYTSLKKRFKNFNWVETKLNDNKKKRRSNRSIPNQSSRDSYGVSV
jgi:hypothetical protein